MNIHVMIDVEANGPCPGLYSMVSIGLATVNWALAEGFQRATHKIEFAPVSDAWDPEAYKVIGITREQHLDFPSPSTSVYVLQRALHDFKRLNDGRLILWSDNPAFDWQWLNWYIEAYYRTSFGEKVHGHSCRRIGDMWSGFKRKPNDHSSWKNLRKTRHTHDPVDDAVGNAEALEEILRQMRGR